MPSLFGPDAISICYYISKGFGKSQIFRVLMVLFLNLGMLGAVIGWINCAVRMMLIEVGLDKISVGMDGLAEIF